jgi:hypothetical protein
MPTSANGAGAAPDASVETGPEQPAEASRAIAEQLADQADAEVEAIEEKLAGWKQALADKKAEAKRLRAAVKEARG